MREKVIFPSLRLDQQIYAANANAHLAMVHSVVCNKTADIIDGLSTCDKQWPASFMAE